MRIYLFPFLIDFVFFLVMLRVADASGREMQLSNLQAAWFVIAYSLAYLVACPVAGRVLTRENSRPLLLASVGALLLCSVPIFFTRTFWPTLWLLVALGVAVGFAFNSLQAFLRGQSDHGGLSRTIAKYTLSWSAGISFGFLVGGVLRDFGGAISLAACSVIACGAILWMVWTYPIRTDEFVPSDGLVENPTGGLHAVDARFVAIGWMLTIAANFSQRPLTTFIPKLAAEQENPAWVAGSLLFALYLCQALGGFGSRRFRHLLYRRGPLVGLQITIASLTALLWMAPGYFTSLFAMATLGLCYGFLFFSCVYYVSNSIKSSRNVGINEGMVGFGTILGVFVCEAIMRFANKPDAFYPVTIISLLLFAAGQWLWLGKKGPLVEVAEIEAEAEAQTVPM